jgi:hypothetical protein
MTGYPGIGKGYILDKYVAHRKDYIHLSYGDLMRKYEKIDPEIQQRRDIALNRHDNHKIEDDAPLHFARGAEAPLHFARGVEAPLRFARGVADHEFRILEKIFVERILPRELVDVPEEVIVILDNFPVHSDALRYFNKLYPQSVSLYLRLQTNDLGMLKRQMLQRCRDDSANLVEIERRIHTYKKIVATNLDRMSKLYDSRSKEMMVDLDTPTNTYQIVESILDLVLFARDHFTMKSETKTTSIEIKDPSLHLLKSYIDKNNLNPQPLAYVNTVTELIAISLGWSPAIQILNDNCGNPNDTEDRDETPGKCDTDCSLIVNEHPTVAIQTYLDHDKHVLFTTSKGCDFYLIKNPRYLSGTRYVSWPRASHSTVNIGENFDDTFSDRKLRDIVGNEVDIFTTDVSSIPRDRNVPCNIVDLIMNYDVSHIAIWRDNMRELMIAGRKHLSSILSVAINQVACFLHYPGASYYSVLHIHFTVGFDHNYNRVHHLEGVISDLDQIVSDDGSTEIRERILRQYSNYTTCYPDLYSFYMCPVCKVMSFSPCYCTSGNSCSIQTAPPPEKTAQALETTASPQEKSLQF